MDKKYEFTDNEITICGHTRHRIRAVRSFGKIKAGDLGGFIEHEDNLSHHGNCWVGINARVWGKVQIYGDAQVFGVTQVYDNGHVYGDSRVFGNAQVYGNSRIYNTAWACGNSRIFDNASLFGNTMLGDHAQLFGNAQVCGDCGVYGTTWVFGDTTINIHTHTHLTINNKIDSGTWVHVVTINDKKYLLSTTLKKILVG